MRLRRFLAVFILASTSFPAFVSTPAQAFSGGAGSAGDPYRVATCADLLEIDDSASNMSKAYVLTANIDCTGVSFAPLVNGTTYFSGTLDGDGFTISNVALSCTVSLCGLFARMTGATVQDITLESFDVTSTHAYVGTLAGLAGNSTNVATFADISIIDSSVATTVTPAASYAGGLVGDCESCSITRVRASGSVRGSSSFVGGLVGDLGNSNSNPTAIISNSTVTSVVRGQGNVGGFVGFMGRQTYSASHGIFDSISSAFVSGTASGFGGFVGETSGGGVRLSGLSSSATVSGGQATGGIVGWSRGTGDTITRSIAIGSSEQSLASCNGGAGGLIGISDYATVSESYSLAAVTGVCRSGGFIGSSSGTVTDSFSRGTLTRGGTSTDSSFGGITGRGSGTLRRVYSAVTSPMSFGHGLAGDTQFAPACTDSFWDTQTSSRTSSRCGAAGKTTVELKSQGTFTNFDFGTVWNIDVTGEINGGYPYLRNVPAPGSDNIAPSVSFVAPSSPSSSLTLSFTANFSRAISGLAAGDFDTTGTASGCSAAPAASSASNSVTVVVTCSTSGTVSLRLRENSVSAGAGNSGPLFRTSSGFVTISPQAAPTVVLSAVSSTSTSRNIQFRLTATSGEIDCATVSAVDGVDFDLTNIVSITVSQTSSTVCTISAVSTISADGATGTSSLTEASSFSVSYSGSANQTNISSGSPASVAVSIPAATTTTTTSSPSSTTTSVVSVTTTTNAPSSGAQATTTTAPPANSPVTSVSPSNTVAPPNPGAPSNSVAPTAGSGGVTTTTPARETSVDDGETTAVAAPAATTTTTSIAVAPTTTLPPVDVPPVSSGGGALTIGGQRVEATITRENNQLILEAGPIVARISALKREGGRAPLDADGRIRMMPGDSVEVEVTGFGPSTEVEVRLYSEPTLLGRSGVNDAGELLASYEIPSGIEDGDHTVVLVGESRESEELVFALSVVIGEPGDGAPWFTIFVLVPLGVAVAGALIIPAVLRRRREEQAA